jgi:hypothetical protein
MKKNSISSYWGEKKMKYSLKNKYNHLKIEAINALFG